MKNRTLHQYTKLDADYIDLRLLLQNVFRKKWLIITISALISFSAFVYAEIKPARYQASLLLKLQHEQQNVLGAITNPSQQLSLANNAAQSLAVQIALIQSEVVLRPVIKSLGLDVTIKPDHHGNKDITISDMSVPTSLIDKPLQLIIDKPKHFKLSTKNGNELLQGSEGLLVSNNNDIALKVSTNMATVNSRYILIKDQEINVLNKLRKNLIITDLTGASDSATNKMSILRISIIGFDPITISNILNQIAVSIRQENINLKVKDAEKSLNFLLQQVPIVKKALNDAEEKLNVYRATSGRIDVKFESQYLLNHLSDLNKELEASDEKKDNLLQNYTENHPFVIALNHKISQLLKDKDKTTKQIKAAPAYEQDIINLTREVSVKNNLYTLLLNQIHQMHVIKSGIASDIEILSPASVPYVVPSIKPFIVSVLAFIVGFILASLGVLGWNIITKKNNEQEVHEQIVSIR